MWLASEGNKNSAVGNANRPPDVGRRFFVTSAPGVELSDDEQQEKTGSMQPIEPKLYAGIGSTLICSKFARRIRGLPGRMWAGSNQKRFTRRHKKMWYSPKGI